MNKRKRTPPPELVVEPDDKRWAKLQARSAGGTGNALSVFAAVFTPNAENIAEEREVREGLRVDLDQGSGPYGGKIDLRKKR